MKHAVKRTVSYEKRISIILLAAGCGERIKGHGVRSLLRVCDTFLINHQVDRLNAVFTDNDLIVVVGFEADKVIKEYHGKARFVENQLYEHTGSASSLRLGMNACIGEHVLIVHGDLWFSDSVFKDINLDRSFVLTSDTFSQKEVGCIVVEDKVSNFSYGLETIWAQISYLTGPELKLARDWLNTTDCSNKFTHECLNHVLMNKGRIFAHKAEGKIIEIDDPKVNINEINAASKRRYI